MKRLILALVILAGLGKPAVDEWSLQFKPGGWVKIHPFYPPDRWACLISADGNSATCHPNIPLPACGAGHVCSIDKNGNIITER